MSAAGGSLCPPHLNVECPGVWRRRAYVCDALPPWKAEGRASVSICSSCGPSQRPRGPSDCGSSHLSAEPRESEVKSKISSKNPVPSSLLMKPRLAKGFELLQENRSSNTKHANVQKSHPPHQTNDLKQQCLTRKFHQTVSLNRERITDCQDPASEVVNPQSLLNADETFTHR